MVGITRTTWTSKPIAVVIARNIEVNALFKKKR
jgi:hypothetical protein